MGKAYHFLYFLDKETVSLELIGQRNLGFGCLISEGSR